MILGTLNIPQKDLLNINNVLNIAFALSVEVTFIFLTTAPSLYLNIIYEQLILTAVYYIDLLVTVPDLYLISVPYLINTICESKTTTNIL